MSGEFSGGLFNHDAFLKPDPIPDRELLRVVIFGSRDGIRETIHELHNKRFRDATTWSPLLPTPDPTLYMSINTHYRIVSDRVR